MKHCIVRVLRRQHKAKHQSPFFFLFGTCHFFQRAAFLWDGDIAACRPVSVNSPPPQMYTPGYRFRQDAQ